MWNKGLLKKPRLERRVLSAYVRAAFHPLTPEIANMTLSRSIRAASAIALLLGPSICFAHPVTLDGSAAEWFATPAPTANLGRISRRAGGGGEYIWRDAIGDARAAWAARPHDLGEIRVTGDYDHLYVMAQLGGPVATSGDSVPQLQVTIDTDRFSYSGGTAFADSAGFDIAGSGAYEMLLETRFGSGQPPRLVNGWGNELAATATAAISPAGVIEIALPWSALGFQFVPTAPLRIGAALFLTNAGDVPLDPHDGTYARAADVMTQYGDPGSSGTTAGELADGVLDYSADLWFDAHGEVVAPIVVNEAYFETGVNSQWIEVVNPTQAVVSLASFKIGDEETPDGSEAIAQFPSGTLLVPGQAYVVARNGATFLSENGRRADAECGANDASTPDMFLFPAWALSTGFNIPNSGDEVLVLDGSNTVVDMLIFKNASWPGVIPSPGAPALHSLERANPAIDTDDCAADFGDQASPNPGLVTIVAGVGAPDASSPLAWAPPTPNPARGRVSLSLRLPSAGDVRVDVIDAGGRRMRNLYRGPASSGDLRLNWDGRDERGQSVPPGLYFVHAATDLGERSQRVTVIR
jgi:hypothetical protein